MRLLYPCDPFDRKRPDEAFEEEFDAVRAAGMTCSLYSAEDAATGAFRPVPPLAQGDEVVYRGWMLVPGEYAALAAAVQDKGGYMLTAPEAYRRCHYLPEWYDACKDLTPATVFLDEDADFPAALAGTGWQAFFVKDYVKSLTTSRGSIARTAAEVADVVALIASYRGRIEGGVCVREVEALQPDSEERYFVVRGKACARDGAVPAIVERIAARIDSPFYAVDIVLDAAGVPRLIELGDGQVSDRKQWTAPGFAAMLAQHLARPA